MGGINCGQTNKIVVGNYTFANEYAKVTRDIFNIFKGFSEANVFVENLVLLERDDSKKALSENHKAVNSFVAVLHYISTAKEHITKAQKILLPFVKQPDLNRAYTEPYKKKDQDLSYELWVQAGAISNDKDIFDKAKISLQEDGYVGFLNLLIQQLDELKETVSELLENYESEASEEFIKNGEFQLAMRDAKNSITALTARGLTQISKISSAITDFCLMEYSTQTSISGETPVASDFVVKKTLNQKEA